MPQAVGLFAAIIGADLLVSYLVKQRVEAAYASGDASAGNDILVFLADRLGVVFAIAVFSSRLSYRPRDNMFLGFVPLLGEVILARLCWRITGHSRQEEDSLLEEAGLDPALAASLRSIRRVPGVVRCRSGSSPGVLDVVLDPWNEASASEIRWLAQPFDVQFVPNGSGRTEPAEP